MENKDELQEEDDFLADREFLKRACMSVLHEAIGDFLENGERPKVIDLKYNGRVIGVVDLKWPDEEETKACKED